MTMLHYSNTAHFQVWYDDALVTNGVNYGATANAILARCEPDFTSLSALFAGVSPATPCRINLMLADPANQLYPGLAMNSGGQIYIYLDSTVTDFVGMPSKVVAELSEIFMFAQGRGWNPAWNNGEALSRVLVSVLYPERAWLVCEGNYYLNSGRPDWLSIPWQNDGRDGNFMPIGVATLFLNYLAYQKNFSWNAIIAAGAPTTSSLAETVTLLGLTNAVNEFFGLLNTFYPLGATYAIPTDEIFPLDPNATQPILYMRHNIPDNGTSHSGPLSVSPDIIVKNNPTPGAQAVYGTPYSLYTDFANRDPASGYDSINDPFVLNTQDNYVYLRVWNRGADTTSPVTATVYWSEVSTLVQPALWNLIGAATYSSVPRGRLVKVSDPGITWHQANIPAPGHYCFVATVGSAQAPAPTPSTFATFDDFVNYIYANNNITWRNFDVAPMHFMNIRWPGNAWPHPLPASVPHAFIPLPFNMTGAWDKAHQFSFESIAALPAGSFLALEGPPGLIRGLATDERNVVSVPGSNVALLFIVAGKNQTLAPVTLNAHAKVKCRLLVYIPPKERMQPHDLAIRQIYGRREVGRITWRLVP